MSAVVGRQEELERLEHFLRGARERRAALVLEGEAGIGKTALWREGLRLAQEQGFRTLVCRPAEAEAKMAYAGLADLLSTLHEDDFLALPDPQRAAVAAALLQGAPRAHGTQARAVAAALLSTLGRLAETSAVLVAVDDVQWLDRATATAVSYSFRRLAAEAPVALLVTSRGEAAPAAPTISALEGTALRLGPLSLSALYHVIRNELGLMFPRPTLQRIEDASGGNPLLAIELARALEEAGGGLPGPGEALPVPSQLLELLQARVAKLSPSARESLLAAALLSAPTVADIARALADGAEDDLEEALDAGLIALRGETIRFRHPLFGAAVLSTTLPARRREMHRRLAAVVEDEEKRARHLALSAAAADGAIAQEVDDAAARADRRGAPEEAAELLELSLQLTPRDDPAARSRRTMSRARAVGRAGDSQECARLLDRLLEELEPGLLRAKALELRAREHWDSGTLREAEAACEEALLYTDDDEVRARVLVTFARLTLDTSQKHERAQAALDVLERMERPDPALHSEALIPLAEAQYCLGRGIPHDVVERGLALERIAPPANVADRMSAAYGTWLKYNGEFDSARTWLERTHQAALDEGDEGALPYALSHLPQIELWTGNWTRSEALALEHLELAERTRQLRQRITAIFNLSAVRAHMGLASDARARIQGVLAEAEPDPWGLYLLQSSLGFLELSLGNVTEAVTALGRAFTIYEESGDGDTPDVFENYPEALVLAGELETAERVIDRYEDRARAASKPKALAPALRCRALLQAARQQLDEAATALDEALAQHDRLQMPFSRARTLLVRGQVRRRRGERVAAKEALDEARAIFDGLGAPLWAERAARELARIPIRRRRVGDELTPSEGRVAEFVAQGLTNQEIARSLFVSVKTVESNLTRIYRKLGVRSRTELAAQLAAPRARPGGRQIT